MKKFKKVLALSLALAMGLSLAACGGTTTPSTGNADTTDSADTEEAGGEEAGGEEGGEETPAFATASDDVSVLHIYCWNTEVAERIAAAVPSFTANNAESPVDGGVLDDGTVVEFVVNSNQGGVYQQALDQDLIDGKDIDMFAIEADYAAKYVDTDFTLDVHDVGLTDDDMSGMYQYTKQIATSKDGKLKGVSWQATPGVLLYNRTIASEVLGSDDPAEVQKAVKDWATFDATAAKMKDAGYFMVSGYDDTYRVFSNNVSSAWVDADLNVVIDDQLKAWVDQTKDYTDKGYNNKTSLWAEDWSKGMQSPTQVFCYFGCPWFVDFSLMDQEKAGEKIGDWGACEGPQGFFWGGTWVVACSNGNGTNTDGIKEIMYNLTCSADGAKAITEKYNDFTNNEPAMKEYADKADFGAEGLGGQNAHGMYYAMAPSINLDKLSAYDQGCNEEFQAAMHNYFEGKATYEEALAEFYSKISKRYADVKVPQ